MEDDKMKEERTSTASPAKSPDSFLLFGRYNLGVEVNDAGLKKVISLKPVVLPKSSGRFSKQRLGRAKVDIVERLITHLLVPGHRGKKHLRTSKLSSGRYSTTFKVVYNAFDKLDKEGKNPVEVLVRAIENSAPKEEVMTMLIAGQRIAKQVDTSPMRRLDLALRWIAQGTFQASFSGKKADAALHDVLIGASQNQDSSFPISKRIDTERQAASSR